MNKRWLRQVGSIVMAMLLMMSAILGDVMPVYAELLEDVSKNDQVIAEETELENPEVEELLENDNARVKAGDIVTNDTTMLLSPDASEENGEISNDTSANETDGSIECWSRAESTTQSRLEMTNFSRSEIANAAADSFLLRF